MKLDKEGRDIIQKICDSQNSDVTREKEKLIKQANDLIFSFQHESRISTNSFSNLITNLTRVQGDFAKQEGIERTTEYFEQIKSCTF